MNPIVNTQRDSTQSGVDGALSSTPHGTNSISFRRFGRAEPRACGAHYIKRLSVKHVRDDRFGWRILGAGATAPYSLKVIWAYVVDGLLISGEHFILASR